ncbi:hypothetical protein VCRLGP8_1170206 [Vibrio crassostreae]|nr:hypothetical protein VCRLGP8_1170206 [Vibrio crassostreae]
MSAKVSLFELQDYTDNRYSLQIVTIDMF